MFYLQSAIEYADEWLEFDPTKSRYKIKEPETVSEDIKDVSMDQIGTENLPEKEKINFITQINRRFMDLP